MLSTVDFSLSSLLNSLVKCKYSSSQMCMCLHIYINQILSSPREGAAIHHSVWPVLWNSSYFSSLSTVALLQFLSHPWNVTVKRVDLIFDLLPPYVRFSTRPFFFNNLIWCQREGFYQMLKTFLLILPHVFNLAQTSSCPCWSCWKRFLFESFEGWFQVPFGPRW